MSKQKKNIWSNFEFTDKKKKTALTYLNDLKEGFLEKTGGELILVTEAVDNYVNNETNDVAAIYKLFVEAPKLGHFRRKILSVAEYTNKGRFPVDIINHMSGDIKAIEIKEKDFDKEIENVLTSRLVMNSIENLFQQSRELNS